ncbi:MAG: S8 family serine peptidase, partial [Candidatus Parabeggiatoa sp.]|nr:S8 family serine peptidase [Candidatus Parabeggiatoa sp.]
SGYDIGAYEKTTLDFEQRRILRTINDVGYAYVIIGLHVDDYQPEGYYDSPEGVNAQRARVADAQKLFVDNLFAALTSPMRRRPRAPAQNVNIDEFLNSVDTFTTVPQLFMKINRVLFETIIGHSLATNMWLNVADSVSLSDSTKIVGATSVWDETDTDGNKLTGKGQYVVVLDTGVDSTNSALNAQVVEGACFSFVKTTGESKTCSSNSIPKVLGSKVGTIYEESRNPTTGGNSSLPSVAAPCKDSILSDDCEHGTHVAGIIAAKNQGVAPEAKIIAIQAGTNTDGTSVELYRISQLKALEYIYDQLAGIKGPYEGKIAAVNMSLNEKKDSDLSGVFCDDVDDDMTDSRKQFIDNLYSYGIATIISSGNNGNKKKMASPACISSAISVGATDKDDNIWIKSNSSDKLDLLAPGVGITSTWPGGGTKPKSGTSQAAPHVAGAWAILKQKWDKQNELNGLKKKKYEAIAEILEALVVTGVQRKDTNGIIKPRIQIDRALDALNYSNFMGIIKLDANDDDDTLVEQIVDKFPNPTFPLKNVCNGNTTSSGAAAVEMTLKYLLEGSPPSQSDVYGNNSTSCNDMTPEEVKTALNNYVDKEEIYSYVHWAYD